MKNIQEFEGGYAVLNKEGKVIWGGFSLEKAEETIKSFDLKDGQKVFKAKFIVEVSDENIS